MADLSIKVSIANRSYPLKIDALEEENIRKAAKLINDRIKDYEENFAVKDKQDVLCMCALQLATDLLNMQDKNLVNADGLDSEIANLDKILKAFFSK